MSKYLVPYPIHMAAFASGGIATMISPKGAMVFLGVWLFAGTAYHAGRHRKRGEPLR